MSKEHYHLLLADDDEDDCLFFKEALDEIAISTDLLTVNDGVQVMNYLKNNVLNLPDVLFLDLNMPLKNGLECLDEIKNDERLENLPIVIFSTSLDNEIVNKLYQKGASYYIRKPGDFTKLKSVIAKALTIAPENNFKQPERANFILQP
ncbi:MULTISPECIES: response regulator [Flavobacterium]|uniref:Response regulator receiver protein n=1 Tax=Flavobacterium anhuiense TaxID=459526 RepID=A0A444W518_9FLAO|nr:response regulator [Flavobacterium anhuiense]RYJ40806.1 Response regulator receiver protein [Flavobacterium anhuiense]